MIVELPACRLSHRFVWILFLTIYFSIGNRSGLFAQLVKTVTEMNPNLQNSGGRVGGLAISADGNTLYAASEWGGIYKSTDRGVRWSRLNNHLPTATWDVAVSPSDPNKVYATSFYDGRVNSRAGINVSNDGGRTWIHPPTAIAPPGTFTSPTRRSEPSAFGISIDPNNPRNVYIGTNTGLAISNDAGATWRYVDPTPEDIADNIWDVVVHHGGIIDLVGNDGHQRSIDGGTSWTTATGTPLPGGRGSITVSPDESYVLFAVVGTTVYESDDGGSSWPFTLTNPGPQGRIPFVETNQRSGNSFDLWFGDVRLWRTTCTTPTNPAPGGARRAPADNWSASLITGGHPDLGDIVFDPTVTNNRCPLVYSNDGGVYYNTIRNNPDCHTPVWKVPDVTPHGTWPWDMDGAAGPGFADQNVYFGTQDNGIFSTINAGETTPDWTYGEPGDVFDVAARADRVQYTLQGGRVIINLRKRGLEDGAQIGNYPSGNIAGFTLGRQLDWFGDKKAVVLTNEGAFITNDLTATPIVWTELGAASKPASFIICNIQVSFSGSTPTFFLFVRPPGASGGCGGRSPQQLWKYRGTSSNGAWEQVPFPAAPGGFGVYSVDPRNPNHILASYLRTGSTPQMLRTTNGGTTWRSLTDLDTKMTGGGLFAYSNVTGPTDFVGFSGYPQPCLVAISPFDSKVMLAGSIDAGIFLSVNSGSTWQLLTDPNNPGSSGIPHVSRPRFAYFGRPNGIISRNNQMWHQDMDNILGNAESNDHFGSVSATGDFNKDGFADLAVGVPDESFEGTDNGSISKAGVVHILYGTRQGISANSDQQWHQGVAGILGSAENDDRFGSSLATGDFNKDGFADLAIGVMNESLATNDGTIRKAGAVHILYGSANGLSSNRNQQWHQNSPGILGTAENDDQFGSSLTSGDFNKDGFADVAIGVINESVATGGGTIRKAGAVHILYGSVNGIASNRNQQWHQDSPGILGTAENDDQFGSSLTSGDFNGDGFDDLVVGVPNEGIENTDRGSLTKAGAVHILHGSAGGISSSNNQQWHQEEDGIIGAAEANDLFGSSLSVADFNGDGFDDLVIGVPNESLATNNGTISMTGAAHVLYGSANRITSSNNQQWLQNLSDVEGHSENNDLFGSSLSTGDFNGDGAGDLVVGVPGESLETGQGTIQKAGVVNVLYGSGKMLDIFIASQGRGIWRISVKMPRGITLNDPGTQ